MIELLLEAERARAAGERDRAERLFRLVADADPRSAIAVVGLAEVALDRGELSAAATLAHRALEIDPEDAAARRIVDLLSVPKPAPEAESAPGTGGGVVAPARWGWLRRLLDRLFGRGR